MKKRKHHYVWKHYLGAWATNGQIWCRRNGKTFLTSTENVAQSRDFYRLREVSEQALLFIEGLIAQCPDEAVRDAARGWIPPYRLAFDIQNAYVRSGRTNPELEQQLDIAINNLEEEMHAGIEKTAAPLLAALKNGDASFLGENGMHAAEFAVFIAFQYLRTPKMMRSVLKSVAQGGGVPPGLDIESAWGLLRTVFATTLSAGLLKGLRSAQATVLDAGPAMEFITADQPAINTLADPSAANAPPKELELYYPVSPARALLLTFARPPFAVHRRQLPDDETMAFNRMLADRSEEQLYASTERALL